jgi:hypothetical protein
MQHQKLATPAIQEAPSAAIANKRNLFTRLVIVFVLSKRVLLSSTSLAISKATTSINAALASSNP